MLHSLLNDASAWLKPYSAEMAVAFVATLLVIYGDSFNRVVRVFVKPYPMVLRISAFILLCTLGYGAITVWGSGQLNALILTLPNVYFAPVVVTAFIVLGVLAERYHK